MRLLDIEPPADIVLRVTQDDFLTHRVKANCETGAITVMSVP